jgi:dienelactone hydrolase
VSDSRPSETTHHFGMTRRRRFALVIFAVAAFALAYPPASRLWRAGELLLALSPEHRANAQDAVPLVETDLVLPGRDGPIRARLYHRSDQRSGPGLVVAHGVHYQGIDERRLVPFARALARAGRVVLTPELRDLTDYRITSQGIGIISDSVEWLSGQKERVSEPRVGLLGFSFAGGLALTAASRPELRGKLAYVTSVGGHHDLARVLSFLVSDEIETPHGIVHEKAHDYGLIVVVYDNVDRFVAGPDRETIRDALRLWLHEDRDAAWARASACTTLACEHLFVLTESQRLGELRPELERLIGERRAELAALSPRGHLADIGVPVYLLHGSDDSVIPPSEAEWADLELGDAPHRALVSPLLKHVEVDKTAALGQELELVDFMSKML